MNTNFNTQNNITKTGEKKYISLQNNSPKFSFYAEMTKLQTQEEQPETKLDETNNNNKNEKENQNEIKEDLVGILPLDELNQQQNSANTAIFDLFDTPEISEMKNKNHLLQVDMSDLTLGDINFFTNLTQNTDIAINSIDTVSQSTDISIGDGSGMLTYKSIEVSKTLMKVIDTAFKTNKPIRLDFGQDTSVILRIGKDGKISADFIPNEKAMETILKNALPELKAKFDEENIPYNQLNYRNPNQNKDNNQNNNKKENKEDE